MPLGKAAFMAKARAITTSIARLTAKERVAQPSGRFGEDYNRLRSLVLKEYPELEPLMPPEVAILKSGFTDEYFTSQPYAELDGFAEQIYQLLDSHSAR